MKNNSSRIKRIVIILIIEAILIYASVTFGATIALERIGR